MIFFRERMLTKLGYLFPKRFIGNSKEVILNISPFSNIEIKLPCNVTISSLDVHTYLNSDKLILNVPGSGSIIQHKIAGEKVEIYCNDNKYNKDLTCDLKVPVKANVYVEAYGNIKAKACNGDELVLKSTNGSITVDKYQGRKIVLMTQTGDIILEGAIQASKLNADITDSGSIKTERLQTLEAFLSVNKGNISVTSSYCESAIFQGKIGSFILDNIHKKAKVLLDDGIIQLSGVDGEIDVQLKNGNCEAQISRILNNSKIDIANGDLNLKIAEDCQENVVFDIHSKRKHIEPTLNLNFEGNDKECKKLVLDCPNGCVQIKNASWEDLFKLKFKK